MVACCGLTAAYDPQIKQYLERIGYSGGGGRSITEISKELYCQPFSALEESQRRQVIITQELTHTWVNKHHLTPPTIYSHVCTKEIKDTSPQPLLPCIECHAIYKSCIFKNAICHPKPLDENFIHTNHQYRPAFLGKIYARSIGVRELLEEKSKNTPFVQYSLGLLQGKYDDEVFEGLTRAILTKYDKEEWGVGMQNFRYSPAYEDFMNIIRITSPAA
ncbi:hypothetical protein F5876DRAFT_38830 [Lentinula aff. lateritia]|uniref:Uncharacterized protein n=1 Tax=Lentinula aff. lateritia TaxID=2804960 RepID=A0ACC1U461_9AGAR|nr:hypothetical protein F5876DRAFT_38830 [Lentinula aff. lateritia]